jgi:hypothetical protein
MPLTPRGGDDYEELLALDDTVQVGTDTHHTDNWCCHGVPGRPIAESGPPCPPPSQKPGLSDRARLRLSTKPASRAQVGLECSVCKETVTDACRVTHLPCKHFYHETCIMRSVRDMRPRCSVGPWASCPD